MAFIYRKPRKALSEETKPKSALHLPSIADATGLGKGTAIGEWKGIFGGKPKHKVDIPPEHLENVQKHHEFMSNMTGLGLMASGFVGPAITGAGVIKGVGREVGGRIRKTMATEQRSRGVAMKSMENVKGLVDYVTRGIWLHGRRTYPEQGATFEGARMKTGNLGEPQGISLTADKELLKTSFAKFGEENLPPDYKIKQDNTSESFPTFEIIGPKGSLGNMGTYSSASVKAWESYKNLGGADPPFARTFPTFGGAPSERVLPAWVAPETQWAQDIIKDAYIESLPKSVIGELKFAIKRLKRGGNWEGYKGSSTTNVIKDEFDGFGLSRESQKETFNKRISQNLLKKGYKALLYSPERYNEYEMRMLDPRDVLMLDMRTQESKGLERMYEGNKFDATRMLDKDAYNLLQQHTFGEIKSELTNIKKNANLSFLTGGEKNKITLYEHALKIHKEGRDPRSTKEKGRSQQNRIEQWKSQASPREGSSLRDIYKTITWEDIERVLGTE